MYDIGHGFLRELSKTQPLFLGWIADNWFGMDPGGGDVLDAQAHVTGLYEGDMEAVKSTLQEYITESIQQLKDYTSTAVSEYNKYVGQGMDQAEAFMRAGVEANRQMVQKGITATTEAGKAAQQSLQSGFQEAIQRYDAAAAQAPEFQADPTAYRNDPNYEYGKQQAIEQIKNQAARMGGYDQFDLSRLINQQVAEYDSQFQQNYFARQSQIYQNQLAGYQAGLAPQQAAAGLAAQGGLAGANVAQNQGAQLAGLYQGLGGNMLQANLGMGQMAGQAGLAQGATMADLYGNLGRGVASSTASLGTNLANIGKNVAEQRAGMGLSANMQAINLQNQSQGLTAGLLGNVLPYIGAAGGFGGNIQNWLTGG